MTRKIQKSMIMLVILSMALFSVGISFIIYDTEKNKVIKTVKDQSNLIQSKLNVENLKSDSIIFHDLMTQTRISVIDESGVVVFDNKTELSELDNHNDREEVISARENSFGEKERYSNSFLKMYYYNAILLDEGYVLRVSTELTSFLSLILTILPFSIIIILIIFIVAILGARKLSKNIIAPIIKADLHSNLLSPYEELDIYFNTMREQKEEIDHQIDRVNKRNMTLSAILNTMQEGLIIFDESKSVVLANHAILNILNLKSYEPKESVQKFFKDDDLLEKIDLSLNGSNLIHKVSLNNKIYKIHLSPAKILNNNVTILLFMDISTEYQNQKHREQFSANVSHELKTPLTSIKGLAELQANNLVKAEDVQEFGKKIHNQSIRLLELIDHIIKLSKFDEDQIDDTKELVKLKDLSYDVISYLKEEIDQKEIQLNYEIENLNIFANYKMMEELIYNLLDNAIKYSDQGGDISISIMEDSDIIIEVKNFGKTIPKKDLPHIFERFYRIDESRDKKTGGTGLGLAIVKHIVNYHQGSIEVKSNKETVFKIRLPK